MSYHAIIVRKEGSLLTVSLNRPESLNALSIEALEELEHVALHLVNEPQIRVVILTGTPSMFSAGLDLKDPGVQKMLSGSMDERRRLVTLGPRACRAWEEASPVTIAAVEGFCIGGGVSLVLACDFRVMGESSYMRIPEIDLGLNYSWGSIPRLVHLAGPAKAKEMILFGEKVPAQKCLTWGLTEQVVQDGSALKAAEMMAEKILKKPPTPVAMTKQAVSQVTGALDRTTIYMDADQFLLTTYSEDHKEGLAAFLEKRPARFMGK